ncbi:thiolase family protein [Candidatus Woesearchaeota archaeon]|nr:thiolase family protein [Candidatus Woesearchaeota archaeon]
MTKFGIHDVSSFEMGYEAMSLALNDAQLKPDDIDAVVVTMEDAKVNDEKQRLYVSAVASLLKKKLPIIRVPAVCGGGGAAFWTAQRLHYNNVLCLAVDKIVSTTTPILTKEIMNAAENIWEQEEGLIFPAQNALVAQMHMEKYGTTHDDLSLIAYKNHLNGALNPKARFFGKKISLDEIKKSPMIATPFNLYDCSISVNGAACAIISNDKTDIEVAGSALATDYLAPFEREDMTTWEGTVKAGREAFQQAGISTENIDVAELHDAFTIVEIIAYEDLGFCKKGEGKELIRKGVTRLDGKMPVNTSGGLKARGHPISPTGLAQVVEIVEQLRGRCGSRQVKGAKIGLTHNIGGAGGTTSVHILKRA